MLSGQQRVQQSIVNEVTAVEGPIGVACDTIDISTSVIVGLLVGPVVLFVGVGGCCSC